jgi:large subunit ribosomal protein L30
VNATSTDRLRVTLVKSVHGQLAHIAASVRGLGLRRRHQTVSVANTPEIRGMIRTAGHLLQVEDSSEAHGGSRA